MRYFFWDNPNKFVFICNMHCKPWRQTFCSRSFYRSFTCDANWTVSHYLLPHLVNHQSTRLHAKVDAALLKVRLRTCCWWDCVTGLAPAQSCTMVLSVEWRWTAESHIKKIKKWKSFVQQPNVIFSTLLSLCESDCMFKKKNQSWVYMFEIYVNTLIYTDLKWRLIEVALVLSSSDSGLSRPKKHDFLSRVLHLQPVNLIPHTFWWNLEWTYILKFSILSYSLLVCLSSLTTFFPILFLLSQ